MQGHQVVYVPVLCYPIIYSQHEFGAVYFDLVPHALLPHILTDYGTSDDYVNLCHSKIRNRLSFVLYSGVLSSTFLVLSDVPQGSVLRFHCFY
jgi:hypothetical protein